MQVPRNTVLPLVFPTAPFDFSVFLSILSCKSHLQLLKYCTQRSFFSFSPPRNFRPSCFTTSLLPPLLLVSQDLFTGLPQHTIKFINCHLGFVIEYVELVCRFECKLSLDFRLLKFTAIKVSSSAFPCSDFSQF